MEQRKLGRPAAPACNSGSILSSLAAMALTALSAGLALRRAEELP